MSGFITIGGKGGRFCGQRSGCRLCIVVSFPRLCLFYILVYQSVPGSVHFLCPFVTVACVYQRHLGTICRARQPDASRITTSTMCTNVRQGCAICHEEMYKRRLFYYETIVSAPGTSVCLPIGWSERCYSCSGPTHARDSSTSTHSVPASSRATQSYGELLHFPRRKVHLSDMTAVSTALAGALTQCSRQQPHDPILRGGGNFYTFHVEK